MTRKPIFLDLPSPDMDKVRSYAEQEQRAVAAFARLLALKGLAAFDQDRTALTQHRIHGAMSGRPIALRLLPEEMLKVEIHAEDEQRAVAAFARLLTLYGLAQYERDPSSLTR